MFSLDNLARFFWGCMTSEIGDLSEFADWALENSVWDGETVDWREASDFHRRIQARIMNLLLSDSFDGLALQFAWIGSSDRNAIAQEINEIVNGQVVQVGFKKSASQFWKKHKKEILIGGAIVGVVTTIAIIAICSGGTATGAAAVGGKAIDSLNDKLCRKDPPKKIHQPKPPQTQLVFNEKGASIGGEFASYTDLLQNKPLDAPSSNNNLFSKDISLPVHEKNWVSNFLEIIGKSIIENPDLFDPNAPLPSHELSSDFFTPGEKASWLGIGGINGMNTTQKEAVEHAHHLAKFAQGHSIDWVYNRSHGPVVDVLEIFTLNLPGASPNTSDLLLKNWTSFHNQNLDRPDAKFLQMCHSQGAIHVRNALARAPEEIRNRVMVEAFAPGALIKDNLCFQVRHYACKGDAIPHGEIAYAGVTRGPIIYMDVVENHKNIIWVEQHPETKSPHDFQNPAFDEIKKNIVESHILRQGEYK